MAPKPVQKSTISRDFRRSSLGMFLSRPFCIFAEKGCSKSAGTGWLGWLAATKHLRCIVTTILLARREDSSKRPEAYSAGCCSQMKRLGGRSLGASVALRILPVPSWHSPSERRRSTATLIPNDALQRGFPLSEFFSQVGTLRESGKEAPQPQSSPSVVLNRC